MLIPIGHEEDTVRRQPWVTYGIMGLCLLVFLATHLMTKTRIAEGVGRLEQAVAYYQEHPYLTLDPRLERILWDSQPPASAENFRSLRRGSAAAPPDHAFASLEQAELDGLTNAGFDSLRSTPQRRWGLVPAEFSLVGLITHLFLHAGWMHLLGNLLFLYLSGPFIEDVWGRPLFGGFYLLSGVVAATVFALRYPSLDAPLIGASGAIAGVIGAFAVRHWRRRIRFFYWLGLTVHGTFSSPAWVILPLWLLREFLATHTMDVLLPNSGGGGVAYWAHVSGFVFGAGTAAVLKFTGWEARFVDTALERQLTVLDNRYLDRALESRTAGGDTEAWTLLVNGLRKDPDNPDLSVALWDQAVQADRCPEAAPHLLRLVRHQITAGEAGEAHSHWREVWSRCPDQVPTGTLVKLAEALRVAGQEQEQHEVVAAALGRVDAGSPAGTLVQLARLSGGADRARLAGLGLAHPDLPATARPTLEEYLRAPVRTPEQPRRQGAPGSAPVAPFPTRNRPTPRALSPIEAVPVGIRAGRLGLDLAGVGRRAIPLQKIRAVSAAAVYDGGVEPNLILDLFLNVPGDSGGKPSSIRCQTETFDPRPFAPSEPELEDAFLSFAGTILAASGATWLLGGTPAELRRYDSPASYETELLRIFRLGGRLDGG